MLRLIGLIAAVMLATQGVALADQPLREWRHVDQDVALPGASAVCGFAIRGHVVGESHFTVFYDNAGNIVKEVDTFPSLKLTVYRPGTDQSYTSAEPAVLIAYYTNNAVVGSTARVFSAGLFERIPGIGIEGGRIEFDAVVVDIDNAGVPLIQFVSLISASGPQLDQPIRFGRCAFFQ
jgi:hypothetical protein